MTKDRFDLTNIFTPTVLQLDRGQQRKTKQRTANSRFKKLAVQWLNQVPFFNQTFVQVDSLALRQASTNSARVEIANFLLLQNVSSHCKNIPKPDKLKE